MNNFVNPDNHLPYFSWTASALWFLIFLFALTIGATSCSLLQQFVDNALKPCKASILQAPAVDKNGGSAPHTGVAAIYDILLDDVP